MLHFSRARSNLRELESWRYGRTAACRRLSIDVSTPPVSRRLAGGGAAGRGRPIRPHGLTIHQSPCWRREENRSPSRGAVQRRDRAIDGEASSGGLAAATLRPASLRLASCGVVRVRVRGIGLGFTGVRRAIHGPAAGETRAVPTVADQRAGDWARLASRSRARASRLGSARLFCEPNVQARLGLVQAREPHRAEPSCTEHEPSCEPRAIFPALF